MKRPFQVPTNFQPMYTTCAQLVLWTSGSRSVPFASTVPESRESGQHRAPIGWGEGSRAKGDQERTGNPRAGPPERKGRRNERLNQSASEAGEKGTRPWRRWRGVSAGGGGR